MNFELIILNLSLWSGAVGRAYREDAAKVMLEKLEGRESSQPEPSEPEQPQPETSVNNAQAHQSNYRSCASSAKYS